MRHLPYVGLDDMWSSSNMNISSQPVSSRQIVHISRETIVSNFIGFGLLFLLLVPNLYLFGKSNAVLDRPLYEWIDFALVGIWALLLLIFPILFKFNKK